MVRQRHGPGPTARDSHLDSQLPLGAFGKPGDRLYSSEVDIEGIDAVAMTVGAVGPGVIVPGSVPNEICVGHGPPDESVECDTYIDLDSGCLYERQPMPTVPANFGTIVHSQLGASYNPTFTFMPALGNAIIVVASHRNGMSEYAAPAGWTKLVELGTPLGSGFSDGIALMGKDSDGTETGALFTGAGGYTHIFEVEGATIVGALIAQNESHGPAGSNYAGITTAIDCGTVSPDGDAFILGAAVTNGDNVCYKTPGAGYVELADYQNSAYHPQTGIVTKMGAGGAETPTMTSDVLRGWWAAALALAPALVNVGETQWVQTSCPCPCPLDYGEDGDISMLTFGGSPAAGVSDEVARADHVHGLPAAPGGGGAAGHYEVIMAPGLTFPPDPVQTVDGTDWVYGWVPDA